MPPDDVGPRGCLKHCILEHERWHSAVDCAKRATSDPSSNDWDLGYDECCAYGFQIECLLRNYGKLCHISVPGNYNDPLGYCLYKYSQRCAKREPPPLPG
jgi:hypothetical protein